MGQYRDQAVAAETFDLLDRGRQHLLAQGFAQFGDDVLADVVGADVGADRAGQSQRTQPGEAEDHAVAQAAVGVQATVDGGQQCGNAQAADHAHDDRQGDDRPERFEQGE
ncbi:hypothetical protein D3C78_349870 [compost metagenome]